jgi:putative membrane protein
MKERGFRPVNFLFGFLMGSADVIPGVSGGTVALVLGIYERLIASIRAVATAAADLVRGRPGESRQMVREVEWGLVIPLGIGIVSALVLGARIIEPLLDQYPVQLRALFFGLIAASISIPWRAIPTRTRLHLAIAVVAAVLAFALVGIPPAHIEGPHLILVFLAAMIAICAMILPGVSGAFLLLVMGMYEPTLEALNRLDAAYVVVFVLGAAIGLGAFSKLLHYLLKNHHDVTMAALVGLMAGSLRALWPYQDETRALLAPPSPGSLAVALLLAGAGFIIVYGLTQLGLASSRRKLPEPSERR